MNAIVQLDRTEALLWTVLYRFESLAALQYAVRVPALLTPQKQAVVALLSTRTGSSEELTGTRLAAPVAALVQSATGTEEAHVLIAQGLLLELIGEAIYRTFSENALTSAPTRELCERGLAAGGAARELIPGLLRTRIGTGEVLLQAIMTEAAPLLRSLDALGEGIDEQFGQRFNIGFADLMGDVAAELIGICLGLDVDRRKLVAFLTGALMGI
jgi:hypothetical protein